MNEQLKSLKEKYNLTPIPEELDIVVQKAIRPKKKPHANLKLFAGIAAAALILIAGINASPTFAKALSEVPVVGSLVKVLTFQEFKVHEANVNADIQVPAIANMENKALEAALNEKYLEENKRLYNDFLAQMEKLKQNGGGHLGVESGYVVKTDNEQILAVGRYVVNTVGSSSTTYKYDTIDKKNELLITLPSLFKDNSYIGLISENIKEQMKQQMASDPKKVYWVEGTDSKIAPFKAINENQSFYISPEGKLVISFNKYEVAPGYMGVVEFVIPTDVTAGALVSREYIK